MEKIEKICDCGKKFNGKAAILKCPCCVKKNRRKRLIANRECRDCGTPIERGESKLCAACNVRQSEYRNIKRATRIENGLCTMCGKSKLPNGQNQTTICELCIIKAAAKSHLGSRSRWHELRDLFVEQRGLCAYSKMPIYLGKDASIDHKIPRARGGVNEISNLEWVSYRINLMKLDLTKEEFTDWLAVNGVSFSGSSHK